MSISKELERLAKATQEKRPLVLVLGQQAWSTAATPDRAHVAAIKRLNRASGVDATRGLSDLLSADPLPADFYGWLAEQYDRQVLPEWLEPVTAMPWNAVFTTAVNPALMRQFRNNEREVEAVLCKNDNPRAPRHRQNLHVTYLFGRAGEQRPDEAPPSTTVQLRRRSALEATPLLARLTDTVTPIGLLVIDGLSVQDDWISADMLAGVLSAFDGRQVLWFGWDGGSEILEELGRGDDAPIVFFKERLGTALRALEIDNRLDLSVPARAVSQDAISVEGGVFRVSAATRLRTSTGAAIVDDTWLAPLGPIGSDAEYQEFRRFHGLADDSRRLVEGVRRGFAIRRTFEADLAARVRRAMTSSKRTHDPILVHGQSGAGKSIAFARLAAEIRADEKIPVLLALRSKRVPGVDELDDFCLQAEAAGALGTVIISDANAAAVRYRDLARAFGSRGRRVVVVGSTYRIIDTPASELPGAKWLLEAPAELDEAEREELRALLARYTSDERQIGGDGYLLPALYRILPDVRPRLAAGLAGEARVAEDTLRQRGAQTTAPRPVGQLGQALIDKGLVSGQQILEQRMDEFLGCLNDAASRVIDYVMLPGKLGCPVPISLLMRAVGGGDALTDVATLFLGIDLFRWAASGDDDIFVQPRLRVEAELICARRLGTSEAEAEIAIRLLQQSSPSILRGSERRFVRDLVHRLGPDGPYGKRYARSYLRVARALSELRTKRGVLDPSLVLQESTLRRRVLRDAADSAENEGVEPSELLEEAREVVETALEEFDPKQGRGIRRACANLRVERAAIYGYRAVQRMKAGADLDEVWQFYLAARDSARSAVVVADSYHGIDVSLWVPGSLLGGANWDDERRAELVADIWDALERVDPELLDMEQDEHYQERRAKIGDVLEDNQLKEAALEALAEMGSRAGYFLEARGIGGDLVGEGHATEDDVFAAHEATTYLMGHFDVIQDDPRCLRYLLRCRWISATGSYLFGGTRGPLPAAEEQLRSLLELVGRLATVEGLEDPRTTYLRAVLLWRLRAENEARDLWRSLGRETEYSDPRRTVRHHLWTDGDGEPCLFHGRIVSEGSGRGRFRVQVDEIRQEVELLERDFSGVELRRGGNVAGGFYIAFNYIGPVAERPGKR